MFKRLQLEFHKPALKIVFHIVFKHILVLGLSEQELRTETMRKSRISRELFTTVF